MSISNLCGSCRSQCNGKEVQEEKKVCFIVDVFKDQQHT